MPVVFNPFTGNLDLIDNTAAAGSDTQVQFNDGGVLGGDSGLVFNKTTNALTGGSFIPTSSTVPANGIYSPGTDQLAISTNGTGRLFVDSSGNVKLDTGELRFRGDNNSISADQASATRLRFTVNSVNTLDIQRISTGGAQLRGAQFSTGGTAAGYPVFTNLADTNTGIFFPDSSDTFGITTGGTERLRITSDGKLGLGTSSPSGLFDARGFSYLSGAQIRDSSHVAKGYVQGDARGFLLATDGSTNIVFDVNGTERARIDSSGRLGVGTTTVDRLLHLASATPAIKLQDTDNTEDYSEIIHSTGNLYFDIRNGASDGALVIRGNSAGTPSEFMRCDSSGRLLVGTSSALSNSANARLQIAAASASGVSTFQHIYSFNSGGGIASLNLNRSNSNTLGTNTLVTSGQGIGSINFAGADGLNYINAARIIAEVDGTPGANDMPGRLVFSVTGDGSALPTEALRITNDRYVRLASGSGGIQFNGDTAAANALDDYEEGAWTPAFEPATGSFTSITYGQQAGVYTRVGNICYCHGNFQVGTVDTTGASGSLRINGLPFPISNTYGLVGNFGIAYNFVGTGDYLKIHGNNNDSHVTVGDGSATAGSNLNVQATEIKAGTYIRFSFTYKVA